MAFCIYILVNRTFIKVKYSFAFTYLYVCLSVCSHFHIMGLQITIVKIVTEFLAVEANSNVVIYVIRRNQISSAALYNAVVITVLVKRCSLACLWHPGTDKCFVSELKRE